MLKQSILLLAASVAMPAHAHGDWESLYWLERLLRNHVKVVDCIVMLEEEDRDGFKENCSVHTMAYTENDVMAEYHRHFETFTPTDPEIDDEIEFLSEHFPMADTDQLYEIYLNVQLVPVVNANIISLYIADTIVRSDK